MAPMDRSWRSARRRAHDDGLAGLGCAANLTRNDYNFCYNDELNRFYVAAEHHGRLARAFEAPPNVYDDWIAAEHFALRQSSATR